MKTYIQPGDAVTITAPVGGTTSGVGILIGDHLFGIATETVAVGVSTDIMTTGVVEIAKTSALEILAGETCFWDDTGKEVDKTASGQKAVGVAVADAANPSATVKMLLVPSTRDAAA